MALFHGFSSEFLSPYYERIDPFKSLLARSTYLTKYCRDRENWTDTIKRVVEGNVAFDPQVTQDEAEDLFELFWSTKALPPGRGLWTGGVEGIVADARYNCWFTTIRSVDDWCWTANQLMLGGGVGVGLQEIDHHLTNVVARDSRLLVTCATDHPNHEEVKPEHIAQWETFRVPAYRVPDSREGWVSALRLVLLSAFGGEDVHIDVSGVRPRGALIRTFGGIACGPGPLVAMLRAVWTIVRGAAGRLVSTVEALDITNHIGLCIKSGNVRRSALIALGTADDYEFRNAKKDFEAVKSHRHTSNNSIAFQDWEEIRDFDWRALVEDVSKFGEPGICNMPLVWETDPGATGFNPCGEIALHDRESCNLAEVFPALIESEEERHSALKLATRYCLRQRLSPLTDPTADEVSRKNMRLGVGLGGVCDVVLDKQQLKSYFWVVRNEADLYAEELGVPRPIKVTTVKPSGTISLLNESSPGMHAPFAPYYIRRTRIAKNDPMAAAMITAGVPYEECVYDKTKHTWVFEFPVAKPGARYYVTTETIRDQIQRQVDLQENWADNSVSATLSFAAHEKEELVELLREFVPRLKSTSCLPKEHGYAQAPYEEITREEYERRYSVINHDSRLTHGGEIEVDECSGGVCPVR